MLEFIFFFALTLIAYTYAGYPLLVALLARFWSKERGFSPHTPTVTLLIAAYNEADMIGRRLENALALDYPAAKLQILVAADGSDDGTVAEVQRYAHRGVGLSYRPARQGKMAAINHAMRCAWGEIVVFSDANNLYDARALRRLVAPFGDARVGATSGAKVIMHGDGALGDTEGLYWRYEDFVKRQETRLGSTTGVCGEILAIRRELFTPAPASTINDDFYLALDVIRRGYDVVYIRDARSYERVSLSAEDERGRRARIVAGRYQAMFTYRLLPRRPLVAWQVLSHKYLRPLIPLAMAGAFLSNLLVLRQRRRFLSGPFGAILFIAQLIFYAASLVGMRLEQTKGVARFLFLPAYLVSSNAAVLAGLFRYLRGTQPVAWQRAPRRRSDSPHHAKS